MQEGLMHGYEEVFTETEYYDGPRQGIANYNGHPHFYDCVFDEVHGYTDSFRLTPVTPEIFQLAMEDWRIWERWESAFKAGRTTQETHPALPEDRARYEKIKRALNASLATDVNRCIRVEGHFEPGIYTPPNKDALPYLQVKWTMAKG